MSDTLAPKSAKAQRHFDSRVGPSVPCVDRQDLPRRERGAQSPLPSGRNEDALFIDHAVQSIATGANDLMDFALRCRTRDDLGKLELLLKGVMGLRQHIDAVATRALQQMDAVTQ